VKAIFQFLTDEEYRVRWYDFYGVDKRLVSILKTVSSCHGLVYSSQHCNFGIVNMLTTIIVDDQQNCIDDLLLLLKANCPDISVVATANSGKEGIDILKKHQPQLVFLDVEMQDMTGFEMLQQLNELNFHVVFTTAFDKYAITAIRFNALDYLLKPVGKKELIDAVAKAEKTPSPLTMQQVKNLKETSQNILVPQNKIALTTNEGLEYVKLDEIVYCLAEGSYTTVYLNNNTQLLVSKSIGKLDEVIDGNGFYRIHNSSLVNLSHIKKFVRTDGGYVVMSNGDTVTVARNRKEEFLELFSKF
jgi:two-component system, LytTR family, response regulator